MFFYCYICKQLKHKQELYVILSGRLIAINYFIKDYQLDKVIGKILSKKKNKLDQPTIK